MRELSVRAASGAISSADRAALQKEIDYYIEEINRIAEETESKTAEFTGGPSTGIH